ncbi:hypothetical protein E2562_039224 [Oryza meyeriana var. granulata]|uniref:Uncharacterized protein n=1 Tax=Oryza meyeriana var. granulata TaxID=110450 RepID=A0A6G1E9R7_9ORYZ|nr:hypothetical protein E2562_039224 [Oryza meyeriana var. granulata]
MRFMSLGQGKTDIIGVDHDGFTANGSFYVMDSRIQAPGYNSFEVLYYGLPPNFSGRHGWYWRSLPPPPYIHHEEDKLLPSYKRNSDVEFPREITATAVVAPVLLNAWDLDLGIQQEWCFPGKSHMEYLGDGKFFHRQDVPRL